jgi:glycosyltransferase involved in cell wall biosynthesis
VSTAPRLTIGLPVYNGETYLASSLDALLGQTYKDFELIISDNASTDGTADICQRYAQQDARVRYIRQPTNIGLAPNHNVVVEQARGELFKWAASDDLYARELIERCIDALDQYPDVVLAHSWSARIDGSGTVTHAYRYPLNTSSARAPERFRSLLFGSGGDDDYGVIRTEVLRRTAMKESYHHADRTIIAELGLYGRFYQVPDWLYFRRDHPQRAQRAHPTVRSRCANMDPRRASRLRHPAVRLYYEYIWAFARAIHRAPLPAADRRQCYRHLVQWFASRARKGRVIPGEAPLPAHVAGSIEAIVAGPNGTPALNAVSSLWPRAISGSPQYARTRFRCWESRSASQCRRSVLSMRLDRLLRRRPCTLACAACSSAGISGHASGRAGTGSQGRPSAARSESNDTESVPTTLVQIPGPRSRIAGAGRGRRGAP